MTQQDMAHYYPRSVGEWVERTSSGNVAIADFQRSFVWDSAKMTGYIKAIFMGKPVGVYLILAKGKRPQFEPRAFNEMDTPLGAVEQLVLDGQQRLTSLLHALHGSSDRRFFLKVANLWDDTLELVDVVCASRDAKTGRTGKGLDNPETAFHANLVPIDVVRKKTPGTPGLSDLAKWCITVGERVDGMAGQAARELEDRIKDFVDRHFFQRDLWYCLLPASTDAADAAETFVATNTMSVKIKAFDVEVAKARGHHDEDLRAEIQEAYEKSDLLRHYFSDDPEDYVPDIGEWLLKVTCLHVGEAPREGSYEKAVSYLLGKGGAQDAAGRRRRFNSVFRDLDWALVRAEQFGVATERMVPSWPTLHVLSALRSSVQGIRQPAKADAARRLLKAYYWRTLFSNRYEVQANDRLFEDYEDLVEALRVVGGDLPSMAVFDERDHPVYDAEHLLRHAGWIGSSRLGKALASAVMASDPKAREWMTGETLSASVLRELQGLKKLDRHHVFPRAALLNQIDDALIHNGLNGVLLDQRTNLRLWKVPPHEYVAKMRAELTVSQQELRDRVESHLVPYAELTNKSGRIATRYRRFLKERAAWLAERIEELAAEPD